MGSNILQNAAWGFAGEVVNRAAKAAQLFLIVRWLGPQEFGRFNSALAAAGLFGVFFDFGIATIALRQVSKGDHSAFRRFAALKALVSAIGLVCVVGWCLSTNSSGGGSMLLVIAAALYLVGSDIPTYVAVGYRARGEFWRETFWRSVLAVWQLLLCALLLFAKVSTEALLYGLFASTLLALIPFATEWRKYATRSSKERFQLSSISECLPIAGSVLVGSIYMNWDVVVLSSHVPLEEVGWYSVAVKTIFGLFIMPLHFLSMAMLPAFARQSTSGDGMEWKRRWLQAFIVTSAAGAFLTVMVAIFAGELVSLLFGRSVEAAGPVLAAYVVSGFFFYLYTPLSQRLLLEGRQRVTLGVQISAALLNLAAVSYLVPRIGIWGAVLSSGVTHALIAVGQFMIVIKGESREAISQGWRPLLRICLFLLIAVLLVGLQHWCWSVVALVALSLGLLPELRRLVKESLATIPSMGRDRFSKN